MLVSLLGLSKVRCWRWRKAKLFRVQGDDEDAQIIIHLINISVHLHSKSNTLIQFSFSLEKVDKSNWFCIMFILLYKSIICLSWFRIKKHSLFPFEYFEVLFAEL